MLAAMPMAWLTSSSSSPRSMAAAAADASVPTIEVACRPFSKKMEFLISESYEAIPSLTAISSPTATAASSSLPDAPVISATARAAGTTEEDGCNTDGR